MKTVSMLEFRKNAQSIIRRAMRGQRTLLTYRGEPVLRLEPVDTVVELSEDDPFYTLGILADSEGEGLSNDQIDRIVYEE